MMKICIIIILAILCLVLIIRLLVIRANLDSIVKELRKTRKEDYNRQLRVDLSSGSVARVASEINKNLDYQKELKLESDRSRRQLKQSVSDIAHDLRTPLTVVKGNLQMLEKEDLSEKGKQYLKVSRKKADMLKEMVDEFFEMSVLESDVGDVSFESIDLISFITDFLIENEVLIREKGLEPEVDFPDKTIRIMADKEILSRVFGNLFNNILKYAKDSFAIGIEEGEDSAVYVRISNHVDSPDEIDISHIFDRTYRADKARSVGGAGLGLYITKLLVEKQKGRVEAEIIDDNLVFTVKLNKSEW